jgi:ABC-2 type transport system permease protein
MRRSWLLLVKDLRVLRRSPFLLAVLVAYPIVIAALVGLVAGYTNSKPRVALVDLDHLPATV